MAPVLVLRDGESGKVIKKLEEADISELTAKNWKAPEVFTTTARDGKTDIWGIIYRPTNFDPNKSYPVIEYIYAGPGSNYVPKDFTTSYWFSGLAELGFIVVQLDGMGTGNRSKAFGEVCYKNLKDSGFPDRMKWIKEAAEKYPYMDIDRVGLYGGSAGGQSTVNGLLQYPEFYKAGVAACGCYDNRMDKIWWNELWMGYPTGQEYIENSAIENADKLQSQLMLILGEMDDNVDPSSTMQLVDALIKADKEFELVVLPGMNHTLGGEYGERKRRDFFIRKLQGEKTPDWNK
ncbi:S9 family peptidase [Fulvivirga maritima]|uniref:alpha/beta hydrolase family protein n=1 Tax=Fulvivirga maritima TaxID=2904247 RepID=UPI001F218612|nr:S9 family peptidase [Fulvivirga maritima]UII26177.1 S9 family peptidase [Fulvivirga maritima]